MRFSTNRPASTARLIHLLSMIAVSLAVLGSASARADATLTFEYSEADGSKTIKKFSTARFYVRIDDPADEDRYLLFEAGKFFPLFAVDRSRASYRYLTPEVTPWMGAETTAKKRADANPPKIQAVEKLPPPVLKATKKKRKIAGVECRVVYETQDDKPVIEHCMANAARLNITSREVITMARTFSMARDHRYGWLGAGTEDEEFISIYSKDLRDNRVLQLADVSNKPLEAGYLRIPREYQKVTAEAKDQ